MSTRAVDVAAVDDVPAAPPFLRVRVHDRELLLLRDGTGEIRAVDLACPHLGSPLTTGELQGTVLECPRHYYAYDLASGRNTFPGEVRDLALATHKVERRDGRVLVELVRSA